MALASATPSHHLNQWWLIVNWTLGNKFGWIFNQNDPFSVIEMNLKMPSPAYICQKWLCDTFISFSSTSGGWSCCQCYLMSQRHFLNIFWWKENFFKLLLLLCTRVCKIKFWMNTHTQHTHTPHHTTPHHTQHTHTHIYIYRAGGWRIDKYYFNSHHGQPENGTHLKYKIKNMV